MLKTSISRILPSTGVSSFWKGHGPSLKGLRNRIIHSNDPKFISLSSCNRLKEIKVVEEGAILRIKGECVESPREKYMAKLPDDPTNKGVVSSSGKCGCSLCRLNLHIQHTDVLILSQFADTKGHQLPREVTGLCKEQHKRMDYLLVMAEKAGLIDKYTEAGKKELTGWEKFNKYYEESVIDEFLTGKRKYRA